MGRVVFCCYTTLHHLPSQPPATRGQACLPIYLPYLVPEIQIPPHPDPDPYLHDEASVLFDLFPAPRPAKVAACRLGRIALATPKHMRTHSTAQHRVGQHAQAVAVYPSNHYCYNKSAAIGLTGLGRRCAERPTYNVNNSSRARCTA